MIKNCFPPFNYWNQVWKFQCLEKCGKSVEIKLTNHANSHWKELHNYPYYDQLCTKQFLFFATDLFCYTGSLQIMKVTQNVKW